MKLSAIDIESPIETATLARQLDLLGYHRLWTTEHYSSAQSASPTVMSAVALSNTSRLRVGSGGVMLRYANAMRVATDFQLLAALFPGRVDVGVVGNRVPLANVEQWLLNGRPDIETFEASLRKLAAILRGGATETSSPAVASIRGPTAPALWTCGLSQASGSLAGDLGTGFAYSPFMASHLPAGAQPQVVAAYRQAFRPCDSLQSPEVILSCYGCCAESEAAAARLWKPLVPAVPSFLGAPAQCREQLEALAAEYQATEVMVRCVNVGRGLSARIEGYQLLAEAFA